MQSAVSTAHMSCERVAVACSGSFLPQLRRCWLTAGCVVVMRARPSSSEREKHDRKHENDGACDDDNGDEGRVETEPDEC